MLESRLFETADASKYVEPRAEHLPPIVTPTPSADAPKYVEPGTVHLPT